MLRGASRFIDPFWDFYFVYVFGRCEAMMYVLGLAVGGFESLPLLGLFVRCLAQSIKNFFGLL